MLNLIFKSLISINYLTNMYGENIMMMGGEPIEQSSEDDSSGWGICYLIAR